MCKTIEGLFRTKTRQVGRVKKCPGFSKETWPRCLRCCFTGDFVSLDELTEGLEREVLTSQLITDIAFLQWETGSSTWRSVVLSGEDTSDITDPYVLSSLEEAYFALQARGEVSAVQTRFLRRYMKYLVQCPMDDRFDTQGASDIFGDNHEFFVNVCRAFQTWREE